MTAPAATGTPADTALGHLPAGPRPAGAPARTGGTAAPERVGSPQRPGPGDPAELERRAEWERQAELERHCDALREALEAFRERLPVARSWGERLAGVLGAGGRLLAAGNGGSAAQAQHLTAELVGRYRDDRPPYSALALHADTSTTTAVANDYGAEEVFARQVHAHGRPGDVLMLLSTSGASGNLLSAAQAGHRAGLRVWALTGPAPNPLAAGSDESLAVAADSSATVQELHLHAIHLLCTAFDAAVDASPDRRPAAGPRN